MIDSVMLTGILAVIVFLIVLATSIRRSAGIPTYESRETQLAKRITDLEQHIKRQDETIRALQELLYDRQKLVTELTERVRLLESSVTIKPINSNRKPSLVLAIGADKMLQIDAAKLRGIRKLQLSIIEDATMVEVERLLEERRSAGRQVQLMHIAAHSGPSGVAFSDGMADGLWLSRNLKDVQVLVIAGCESHSIASLLTVVPFVVSMRDRINNNDASTFAYHFWFAIGEGKEPENAYYEALDKCNSAVSEMAEYHSYT